MYRLESMEDVLAQLLGFDPDDPEVLRGRQLAEADRELLRRLRQIRIERNMSQQAVGDLMGITQPSVAAFEAHDNDPKLSTVRRYAMAIGALVRHEVEQDEGQALEWMSVGSGIKVGKIVPFTGGRHDLALAA